MNITENTQQDNSGATTGQPEAARVQPTLQRHLPAGLPSVRTRTVIQVDIRHLRSTRSRPPAAQPSGVER